MSEFVRYLHELFEPFGSIESRKMFGGHGIYHDGLMFGLVADDELYLKSDSVSEPLFREEGLDQFEYDKNGKVVSMSYFRAPESVYDDSGLAREWATRAFDAALRARKKKSGPRR